MRTDFWDRAVERDAGMCAIIVERGPGWSLLACATLPWPSSTYVHFFLLFTLWSASFCRLFLALAHALLSARICVICVICGYSLVLSEKGEAHGA